MLTEVNEVVGKPGVALNQAGCCLREECLTPVGGVRNPRCTMDVQTQIVVPTQPGGAGVQPHPHPQVGVARPRVITEVPLGLDGRGGRLRSRPEDRKERVASVRISTPS